jgi:winged helix-turn-helix DNA-binding protein
MSAPAPQTNAVTLDQITLDDRAWPRDALDPERVELFAEMVRDAREAAGTGQGWSDPLPPLVVVGNGRGGYVLADGRHRFEARRGLGAGFDLVQVAVFQPDGKTPVERAYELSLSFATISAKPLTTSEKRAAILRLLVERPDLSDRGIARLVGVSNSTVTSHRRALCDSHSGGEPEEADGTELRQPSTRREPLRWEVAARRLAEDTAELLASCRKLLGGADFKSAGRELYDALAGLYGDEDALEVIDELSTVVGNARAHARKVAQVE